MNFPMMFHKTISFKKIRKWILFSLIFGIFTSLLSCATYHRIQASKSPRFETGPSPYKGAQSCRSCHEDIYNQWKNSRHADATGKWFDDAVDAMPYFPTEMVMGKGMCYACHGPETLGEGVSCEVCHGINDSDDIETVHEKKYSPGIDKLRQAEFCGKCHKNIHPLTKHVINGSLLEWQESPAAKENIQCAQCHMKKHGDAPSRHGFMGTDFPSSLRMHKAGLADDYLFIVLENQNKAHFIPTGGGPNVYRVQVELLDASDQLITVFAKDLKKTYEMSSGFPSKLLKDTRLKSKETREITFPISVDDKNRAAGINVKIIHLEVELDDDGEIKAIRRETVRLEENNVSLS